MVVILFGSRIPCLPSCYKFPILMCPSLLCQRIVSCTSLDDIAASPEIASPCKTYNPCFRIPFKMIIKPFITLKMPFFDLYELPLESRVPRDIRFLLRLGTNLTLSRVLKVPSQSLNQPYQCQLWCKFGHCP